MKSCKEQLEQQLAIDYDCTIEELHSKENIFRRLRLGEGARPICGENAMLKIAIYNEKLLVMAQDSMMDWCKETFAGWRGTWFSEPQNLILINKKLQEYGQKLIDAHHYYIPSRNVQPMEPRFEVKWFEQDEIEAFRDDSRFDEALLFDEETPDMLAVCAMEGDTILGMASVTGDTDLVWQIGVNVTPEGRGQGVGGYVTSLLKDEVMKRGYLPIYATVESHIKSQKVAFQAGLEPAFYEVFSE